MKNRSKAEVGGEGKRKSFFFHYIDMFFEFCYNAIFTGIFGKLFTSYSELEKKFNNGFLGYFIFNNKTIHKLGRKGREKLSKGFSNSFIIKKLGKLLKTLMSMPLRSYGGMVFNIGIYTVLVYFIKLMLNVESEISSNNLYFGIVTCIVAIPLILSKESLSVAVYKGKITNLIFSKFFGFKDEAFEPLPKVFKFHSNLLSLLGIALGLITVVVDPFLIILVAVSLVALSLIIVSPEIGVLASIFLLPFFSFLNYPTFFLSCLIILTTLSFILKVVRGKRILKFKLVDFFVVLFAITIFMSGVVSVGGDSSFYKMFASFTLVLGYFLVVNLMRSTLWIKRCIIAITTSSSIVALIGVIQYFFGELETTTIDRSYFSNISGRVFSLFENSNVLGAYIAICLPMTVAVFILANSRSSKIFGLMSIIFMFACAVFTWSRGAWLAILISVFIFLFFYTRKTGRVLFFGILSLPFASFLLPQNIIARFLSIGDIGDSSTMYRVYIWKGTLRSISESFWSGVGYGTDSFSAFYPRFAYAGIEAAEHSHNLFLQILFSMGITGLLIFTFVVAMVFQQSLEYIKTSKDTQSKLLVAATFSSIIASLVLGMFDYLWFNYRIFFLFWIIVALVCAFYRTKEEESDRKAIVNNTDPCFANTDLTLN